MTRQTTMQRFRVLVFAILVLLAQGSLMSCIIAPAVPQPLLGVRPCLLQQDTGSDPEDKLGPRLKIRIESSNMLQTIY